MYIAFISVVLFFVVDYAQAAVSFTSPAPGSVIHISSSLTIAWIESGTPPLISQMTSYELQLCAGGEDITTINTLTTLKSHGDFQAGSALKFQIDPSWAGSDLPNAYFVRMIAKVAQSSSTTVIYYSPRFSLTGMTGSFVPAVYTGVSWLGAGVITGPPSQSVTADESMGAALSPWDIPLSEQLANQLRLQQPGQSIRGGGIAGADGVVYAPMQIHPGKEITATGTEPLWPSSTNWIIAESAMLPNTIVTATKTRAVTWSFIQSINTFEPAAQSSEIDDMDKYLMRWKD